MAAPILATKLFAPPVRSDLVLRQRLIDRLHVGDQRQLTLISAPAGYGKTTLISNWLHETNLLSAWLSLDEDDNDPIRFFQYLIAALQKAFPALGSDLPDMLQRTQSTGFELPLNLLINEILGQCAPFVLVLDDFHVIRSQAVLDMVAALLEHMPPQMRLVLISRMDPPLPLARLRVRNQLVDIRAEQLRFTPDEIAVFLNEIMQLRLSDPDIAAMEARTEGWIASLQLAALSMQASKDINAFITAFAGSHHYIMDYLVEEVLNTQPEEIRSFLVQTSILGRMCAPLCEAVVALNDKESIDGQELLETLEKMNLFTIPLDNERHWYRYHHLFVDVLNRYLERQFPERIRDLHRRASRWYEQNGFVPEAIHHSVAAGDLDATVQLIEQNGCMLMMRGEAFTLLNWIEAVESYSETRPWIAILKAWAFALTGHLDGVEPVLHSIDHFGVPSAPSLRMKIMLGSAAAVRAFLANMQGDTDQAVDFAQQALEYLPTRIPFAQSLRSLTISILGDASRINGDLEKARQAYLEAGQLARSARNVYMSIIANSHTAEILIEQGELRQSARIYAETLQLAENTPLAERVFAGLGQISYEWNRLEEAVDYAHRCIALSKRWNSAEFQMSGYMVLAKLEQAQSHPEKAEETMRLAEGLAVAASLSRRAFEHIKSSQARLWIAQDDPERIPSELREKDLKAEISYLEEPQYLIVLRLLLSRGEHEAALALSQRLLQKARPAHRVGRVIEVLVLQALIFQARKEMDQALIALNEALSLARPNGYVRTFLDEGEPMLRLLRLAKSRRLGGRYTTDLLSAAGQAAETQPPEQPLIASLSGRELEVLKLIEAGCSNQEIGDKLFISLATVKRHISNIYAKFGAKSRTQALSIGKELGLFK